MQIDDRDGRSGRQRVVEPMKEQSRLGRALKFSWIAGVALLLIQFAEHAVLDDETHPYLPEPGPAIHAMAVMLAIGAATGFLLGWFWHWRETPGGSAGLGALGLGAVCGGIALATVPPTESLLLDAIGFALFGSLFGAFWGYFIYYEKKDGVISEVLGITDLWDR
ncbi:MAG: hypothetical protein ACN0LA_03860 [Candidatus Longimicrobiales bacterium M2_2A_002]